LLFESVPPVLSLACPERGAPESKGPALNAVEGSKESVLIRGFFLPQASCGEFYVIVLTFSLFLSAARYEHPASGIEYRVSIFFISNSRRFAYNHPKYAACNAYSPKK